MQELLSFIEEQIQNKNFIGVNTNNDNGLENTYIVDFWLDGSKENDDGSDPTPIRIGKQRTFVI